MVNANEYQYIVSAAGRVNIIGEHVDYCGGKVFPAALSLCNKIYVRPNGTDKINISWTDLSHSVTLDINNLEAYRGVKYANYPAGAAYFWQKAGHKVVGCDMVHDCDIPFGSGLSSSAAIEVSTIAALAAVAGEAFDKVEAALVAQKAEIEYAGVNCGIMDQYVSANGRRGHALLLDCKTLDCAYFPLELGGYSLVIANSRSPHKLASSKYNERRSETEEALKILQTKLNVSCLADVSKADFEKYAHLLPDVIRKRAKHVVEECARVNQAAAAMKAGDMILLGRLLDASHESLKTLYEVTGDNLDALAAAAQAHPACIGSRMTGGGFGGCTISLVKTDSTTDFKQYVKQAYFAATGIMPDFYESDISDGIVTEYKNLY